MLCQVSASVCLHIDLKTFKIYAKDQDTTSPRVPRATISLPPYHILHLTYH